jgi:cysteine sulfinate desulfinase/cysteine desulfurase-like protein
MEPISTAAAMAIAKIAFEKFIEGGAVELGKNLTLATSEKVRKLGTVVWNKIQGKAKAVEVLEKAAEDKPEEMQKLKNYLHSLWKDENSEFAREVKKLADEIHFELTQIEDNSSMTQINRDNSTGYQTRTGPDNTNFFGGTHNHGK